MTHWQNWSGKITANPKRIHHVRSEADAAALANQATAANQGVRAVGAAHSHMPLVPTNGVIADMSGLSGVISTDSVASTSSVWAGTPIYAMGRPLHDAGLALINQGDIDRQAIGGAVATGTHGTGPQLTNLSAMVLGATIATASGDLVTCGPEQETDIWRAVQLNLGGLGLVTRLTLQLTQAFRLRERGWTEAFDDIWPQLPQLPSQSRHFEFFWFPTKDTVTAKAISQTQDQPEYPMAAEGQRVGWNYEVLPNHRDWPHSEMEYSVNANDGPACLAAIRHLFRTRFPNVPWPVEYRTVAQDQVWLSPANGRPTVTISVHMDVNDDDEPLFAACEEIFVSFGGRPHWGKVNSLSGQQFADHYPEWDRWWNVRNALDPSGTFLNPYLQTLRQ